MGHTAGEWRTEAVSDAVRVVVGDGRKKVVLARLCPPQLPEQETADNARLMAAAPKLLAALKDTLARHADRCGCRDEADNEGICPGVVEAEAAVAAAELH